MTVNFTSIFTLYKKWCKWFLSALKGEIPLWIRRVMTIKVSSMGIAMIKSIDAGVTYASDLTLNTAIMKPKVSEPLSPIKIFAGCQLNSINALTLAMQSVESVVISVSL